MCLSAAYKNKMDDSSLLMKNIASISVDGEYIVLTDLMEKETRIKGSLTKVDLLENFIIIRTEE